MNSRQLQALVRTVPDFPAPGIMFRDLTTLFADPAGLAATVDQLASHARSIGADAIAGIEARGFILGAAIAAACGKGFVPLRKAGKLPVPVIEAEYELEYGNDRLELDPTLIADDANILLVDDLIATGGTALAALGLLRRAGARVTHGAFAIDLADLGGSKALREADCAPFSLMAYPGK
ncbi:Adenine phosphoribosyltransferase [Alteripontixanthobacter maritimus]|uniref:Adenine phosphoribosyltransferase n=1 Tax=Alteripontixanthobacter maritimus TaxID=2161824 RepID=A0A369Q9A2_9SPHN|nr:adenine phosphoribosyltransferase [Alteripontixanthobacter maritimus]RDC61062.1 Adenine phosphoribosyltransferase [Alteripontixanthobacter maritimus]